MGHFFRRIFVAVAIVVVGAASGGASGRAVHSSRHVPAATTASGPGFLSARGWTVLQTGLTVPPQAPSASAANVRFAAADRSQQSPPTATVSSLRAGGVVLWAQFEPSGQFPSNDRGYPERTLPLRLADARKSANPEGFAGKGAVRRIDARASGYDIDVVIFFGSVTPSARALTAARDELARLALPRCPATAQQLVSGDLQAATTALTSWLHAHYVGRPSDLRGARVAAAVVSKANGARVRVVTSMCRAEAPRMVAVTVTPSAQGRANIGSLPLLYFLSKTANGWSIWRAG